MIWSNIINKVKTQLHACVSVNVTFPTLLTCSVCVSRLYKQLVKTKHDNAHGCLMISARLRAFLCSPNRKVQDFIGRCLECLYI